MTITFKLFNRPELTKTYRSVEDFLSAQNQEIPEISDLAVVISVSIGGEPYPFTGNIAALYYKLNQ